MGVFESLADHEPVLALMSKKKVSLDRKVSLQVKCRGESVCGLLPRRGDLIKGKKSRERAKEEGWSERRGRRRRKEEGRRDRKKKNRKKSRSENHKNTPGPCFFACSGIAQKGSFGETGCLAALP